VAAVVGIVHIPESSALSRLQGGGGSAASDLERQQNLSESFDLFSAHPLTGAGFQYAIGAHNIYLQALVIAGPVGLTALAWGAMAIVATGLRGIRRTRSRDAVLLAGLTAGYFGYLASAVFDNILWDRYLWIYVSLLIVWSASTDRSEPRRSAAASVAADIDLAPAMSS
jgi:O-antigen ligase